VGRQRVVKTFGAVLIEPRPVCCIKKRELVLLGSQTSTTLKCMFPESLVFPKTIHILDAPPLSDHSLQFISQRVLRVDRLGDVLDYGAVRVKS
jgi:hypothetical protein